MDRNEAFIQDSTERLQHRETSDNDLPRLWANGPSVRAKIDDDPCRIRRIRKSMVCICTYRYELLPMCEYDTDIYLFEICQTTIVRRVSPNLI